MPLKLCISTYIDTTIGILQRDALSSGGLGARHDEGGKSLAPIIRRVITMFTNVDTVRPKHVFFNTINILLFVHNIIVHSLTSITVSNVIVYPCTPPASLCWRTVLDNPTWSARHICRTRVRPVYKEYFCITSPKYQELSAKYFLIYFSRNCSRRVRPPLCAAIIPMIQTHSLKGR